MDARKRDDGNSISSKRSSKGLILSVLDTVSNVQVPHGYFKHLYILSVLSSVFWAVQILNKGNILRSVAGMMDSNGSAKSMSMNQIFLLWSFLLLQGIRRLFESVFVMKPSASKMWIVHYVLGLGFYMIMGITVWIEGAGMSSRLGLTQILNQQDSMLPDTLINFLNSGTLLATKAPLQDLSLSAPSKRTLLCTPLFILASGIQYDCHAYLASLPKYTLPEHPMFQLIICPHYFAECVIYISLAILGAPEGAWVNKTLCSALLFVIANLGVTASTSKEWYAQKFGKDKVAERWKMIPFVY